MNAAVVGASAGLGRALAERLAADGHHLVVVASDVRDLEALVADLRIRYGVRVVAVPLDLGREGVSAAPLARAVADLGEGLDALLLPVGWTASHDEIETEPGVPERLLRTNFLSVVTLVAGLLPALRQRPRASIVGFGSVAAIRGRAKNVVYSASKRALQTYFEGLRHACAGSTVSVAFYVLGYLDTNLAFGRRTLLPRADPARLAARVVRDLGRREGVMYHPALWRLVCAALALLPFSVYRRLKV